MRALIHRYGGPTSMADRLSSKRQNIYYWLEHARIPIQTVADVAAGLGVSPWGLNYPEMKRLFEKDAPSWAAVVKKYKFDKDLTSLLIELGEPDTN